MRRFRPAVCFGIVAIWGTVAASTAAAEFDCGFSRVDITPQAPLRLSGYGNRARPAEGTDVPLFVRALALRADDGPVQLLLAVDSIGFPASFSQEIVSRLEREQGLSASRVAICASHSHTTPHLQRGLDNLFATPLTDAERAAATTYTDHVRDQCVAAAADAIADLQPGRLQLLEGTATFARNRRVIKDGKWTGFGENPNGPTDHRLPVLAITQPDGKTLRGIVFNYACHCTTFGGDYNRVNGDWAGYAAEYLEAAHPGCVALCAIGCGADQNPERDPKRALDIAQAQGHQIADEVQRLWQSGARFEITAAPTPALGFAGLPIDRPTTDDLKKALESSNPQTKHHAEVMLATHARMGRLPESYPMPIQVWRFGDQFAMVFLGGEVCVEYAHRIRRELEPLLAPASPPRDATSPPAPNRIWVAAYANDVFGYVACERMRSEGGYEVDFSMIYYLQPGRWSSGTEDVILRRVHELFSQQGGGEPLSVNDALQSFTLPPGFEIELVAAEPLVTDPVNFAVDAAGRLWVVEMGDYPRGAPDASGWSPARSPTGQPWDGPAGGRIKVLTDRDADGRYDTATTFLDGLHFPTGVCPWRDGVLISSAPDILFARDTDGDGRCDEQVVLYTGFEEDNPQHRVNGFEYGLDGWLYLASGTSNKQITCVRTGAVVNISGRDLRIHPDTNRLEPVSGRSQYGRCRDDYGNWFGNTNGEPLFQFVIEDRDLQRNPHVPSPSPRAYLTDPPRSPPVYPTSRTLDRFNDLHTANRFTSACSPCVFRDDTLGDGVREAVFICEPVHNLVSRVQVRRDGPQFTAARHPAEQTSEFLSSTDPWFRPVRLLTGPDGALWVCDMYRQVIEHPEWIPEAWQARLNLSAGHDRGRIYRVRRQGAPRGPLPNLMAAAPEQLIVDLAHPNGWRRDTAQRLLLEPATVLTDVHRAQLRAQAIGHPAPAARVQSLWTLVAQHPESHRDAELSAAFLQSNQPDLVIAGLQALGIPQPPHPAATPSEPPLALCTHPSLRVRVALALAAGDLPDPASRTSYLSTLAVQSADDPWLRAAILSSAAGIAPQVLQRLLERTPASDARNALVDGLIVTALGENPSAGALAVLQAITPTDGQPALWQLTAVGTCLDALARRKVDLPVLLRSDDTALRSALERLLPLFRAAAERAADDTLTPAERVPAIGLLGRWPDSRADDRVRLEQLLTPQQPPEVQLAAVTRLAEAGHADLLLAALRRVSPQVQAAIESALLQRRPLTQALVDALRADPLAAGQLSAATRAALVAYRDDAIRNAAAELIEGDHAPTAAQVTARIAAVAPLSGDAAHGQIVFEKRCSTCHRHRGLGVDVGPQLAALQNKSTEFLLTAILDVNRSVEPRYRSCSLLLHDGRQQVGLIVEETATSLTLATADGRKQSLLRRDIEELTLTGLSFMPEGLDRDLSDQDLADVVAFVRQAD